MYPIYTKPVLRPLAYTCQKHWGQTKILVENGVNNCHACYYQLHQLHTVSRSLTSTATATLVRSFVTSRLDSLHWSPCYSPELPRPRSALFCVPYWSGIQI